MDAFRVIIRGKFDNLDKDGRAALAAKGGDLMFSEAGTFTYDVNATAFTFRCQVPAEQDDDEKVAKARAEEALVAHGLPYRDLDYAVTDMRAVRVRRKKR